MTSTSVKDVGFRSGGLLPVNARTVPDGGFQTVWNSQTERRTGESAESESTQTSKISKTPGDSLKARDEHRARTEKREPSRDAEERADIPEEEIPEVPDAAVEVFAAAAAELIQKVSDVLEVSPEELKGNMEELGMSPADILVPEKLGELVLAVKGVEDTSALVTDEGLYSCFQEAMAALKDTVRESAAALGVEPEQMPKLLEQLPSDVPREPSEAMSGVDASAENALEQPEEEKEPLRIQVTDERETRETRESRTIESAEQPAADTVRADAGKAAAQTESGRRESRHGSDREQGASLFAQNMRAEAPEPRAEQINLSESAWDVDTENIMRQIMDYMKINLKPDASSVELQLHPASLGTLQIQIASKGGMVTANFVTQNEAVKAALETQMIQLKEQFEEQGIKVEAIEVTVQAHEFERNLDQGRENGGQGREPAKRGRARRISLEDSLPGEEPEPEELLARELLAANGNTVDYSA